MLTLTLLAQGGTALSLLHIIIIAVVVIAAIAIGLAVAKHFGVTIPPVLITIFWIVVVAVVAIIALKLLLSMV